MMAPRVPATVMVHRQQLLDQWDERLAMFLNLPAKAIVAEPVAGRSYCNPEHQEPSQRSL